MKRETQNEGWARKRKKYKRKKRELHGSRLPRKSQRLKLHGLGPEKKKERRK
jgi:hypothetical protein